jgi:hypothetical protein
MFGEVETTPVAPIANELRSARYLPPQEPPPAPVPAAVVPTPPKEAPRDNWRTGLLILVTGAITLFISQLLFAFFK